MNAERLHNLLAILNSEIASLNLIPLLRRFKESFVESISTPSQQTSDVFTEAQAALWAALEKSTSNTLSPSQKVMLKAVKADAFFGKGLRQALEQILAENAQTPGQAASQVSEYAERVTEYWTTIRNATSELEKLGVPCDYTRENEYEIGILIPAGVFKNNIEGLSAELELLSRYLKSFGDLVDNDLSNPTLRGVSDNGFELFVNARPDVADCIADAIQQVVDVYLSSQQIRRLRSELKDSKVPTEALKPLEDHERKRINEEIERIVDELSNKHGKKADKLREREIRGHLVQALRHIARRIDQGVDFEVTPPFYKEELPADATAEQSKNHKEQRQRIAEMATKGRSVTSLPAREQEILNIMEWKTEMFIQKT